MSTVHTGLWGSNIIMTMLLGIMAATGLSILLTSVFPKADMLAFGWRYAFGAGALLAIFALYLRSQAVESGFFEEAKEHHGTARTVTKRQLTIIAVRILMLSLLTNVLYYTWVSFASSFAISGKGMDPNAAYIATFAAVPGGTAPYLHTWLSSVQLGWVFSLYIVVLAIATLVTIRFIPETAGIEMNEIPLPGEEAAAGEPVRADMWS
ncbi:hypothetical protein [Arthrobacter sp. SPG23]|uniref:hypothetical protein n=1 Tax=Arthrobacter sp. SPG23 TaxID=1610703 RepID=UPI000B185651|nr:hypothetical protein [Arthrobacter sp. SPG23]